MLVGGGDGSEIEMVKEIFMDINFIFFCVIIIVSIVYMIFEILVFGFDIVYYCKKKDNVGIFVRFIFVNVFM